MNLRHVLVVGAGMCGLTAARRLRTTGHTVTVVDKGRAVGGRMASKRFAGARFDTGAQHFSARSHGFTSFVDELADAGVVRPWYIADSLTQPDRTSESRWVGVPAMRSVCEHLALDLDVRLGVRLERIDVGDGRLVAVDTDGETTVFDAAIVTAPINQALGLLRSVDDGRLQPLQAIEYWPSLVVMAVVDRPPELADGHLALSDGPIAWVADNHHKGVSEKAALTVHASRRFSVEHLEDDPSVWAPTLIDEIEETLEVKVLDHLTHRWRYAEPKTTLSSGSMTMVDRPPVIVAGEVFAGAKVEGAYLSGVAAAAALDDLA